MKVRGAVLVFVSLFVPFAYFNHSDGWNQGARLAELHAIVLKGTLRHRRVSRASPATRR